MPEGNENTLPDNGELQFQALNNMGAIEQEWRHLQSLKTSYVYQNYDWIKLAYEHLEKGNQPLILVARREEKLELILPLVIETGAIKTIRWPGKTHANICCGIYTKEFLASATRGDIQTVVREIGKATRGPAVLRLGNQPVTVAGFKNPMVHLPHQQSTNIMFDMDLTQGMDAILDAGNGKRKRRLFRKQMREADKLGGAEITSPVTKEEIEASLADFYEQKALRFKEIGVWDVFSPPEVKSFLHALISHPERDGVKLLRFFELKIGGKTRAMYGCAMLGDYCQAWINSVTYDDFADYSPGEMVLYMMIEQLIVEGFQLFDLGVGSERYKKSWCKSVNPLIDVIMPLSATAMPVVAGMKAKTLVKSKLRNDDRFWIPIKTLRKLLAGLK